MKVHFACPTCEYPLGQMATSHARHWQCPRCDHALSVGAKVETPLKECVICGNGDLYKRKDFPHTLGMGILLAAFLTSTVTYAIYAKWWTWVILIASAAFDGLLYLWVKDVIVCYRCNAHHRGLPDDPARATFELTTHERYRQERARLQSIRARQQG